jgi:hypothetical protein
VEVQEAKVIDVDFIFDNEEFHDMVQRASTNPEAILCGTFHSYKAN